MLKPVDGPAAQFIEEVCDWLLAKNDPRLSIKRNGDMAVIEDLVAACADFCGFMASLEERGISAKKWRDHVHDNPAGPL